MEASKSERCEGDSLNHLQCHHGEGHVDRGENAGKANKFEMRHDLKSSVSGEVRVIPLPSAATVTRLERMFKNIITFIESFLFH